MSGALERASVNHLPGAGWFGGSACDGCSNMGVPHRLRLPGEAEDAPPLEVSKARLDGVWSSLGQWEVSLPMAGWNEMSFMILSNPNRDLICAPLCRA